MDGQMNQAAQAEPLTEMELLKRELHLMKTAGIIEVAVRNPSVSEYMEHWEGRALKAEDALSGQQDLIEALTDLREYVQTSPVMLESEIIARIDAALHSASKQGAKS